MDEQLLLDFKIDNSSGSTLSSSSSLSEDVEIPPWNEQTGLILFFAMTLISILIVIFYSVRQHCYHRTGFDICPIKIFCFLRGEQGENQQDSPGQNSEQYHEDHILAEALQRRLNEEAREQERLEKRRERKMWYEYYMKPCSMVVGKSDLFYAQDKVSKEVQMDQQQGEDNDSNGDDDKDGPVIMVCQQKTITKNNNNDEFIDSDDEEIGESAKKRKTSQFILCDEQEEDAILYMKLPATVTRSVRGDNDSVSGAGGAGIGAGALDENNLISRRCVDGTCTLCIDEYEDGDIVVWSDLACSHVFHKDCLMQWLSKGKKRCPVCRHWFVPGAKIDDQKLAHGETWKRSLKEMKQREKDEEEESKKRLTLLSQKMKPSNTKKGTNKKSNVFQSDKSKESFTETVLSSSTSSLSSNTKLRNAESGLIIPYQNSLDSEYTSLSDGSLEISELDTQEMTSTKYNAELNTEKSEACIHDEFNEV